LVSFDINKVREQIENLKLLPNVKEVIALRKRLTREFEKLSEKAESLIEVTEFSGLTRNQKISRSLKKQFNYLRQIRNQYPNISWLELRREFSKRKKGKDSKIPDVVWQNPSP
jgi:hypothetical protein